MGFNGNDGCQMADSRSLVDDYSSLSDKFTPGAMTSGDLHQTKMNIEGANNSLSFQNSSEK